MCQMEQTGRDSARHKRISAVVTDSSDNRAWNRLTPGERAALAGAGFVRVWRAGETIARQGDPPATMFIILHGWVKIWATNDRGDNAPLAARGPGEIVGELAPITGLPRTATIQAIDDVRALVIPSGQLRCMLRQRPHIAEELIRAAAIRLHQSDRMRLESGGADFTHRLAAVLLELSLQRNPDMPDDTPVELHFTQAELASFARVSRSTLIRGLDELRGLGVVETARGRVTITRPDVMRELAAGRMATDV